jgi:hypothetical protein
MSLPDGARPAAEGGLGEGAVAASAEAELDLFTALHSLSSVDGSVRTAAGARVVEIALQKQHEFDSFRRKAAGTSGDGQLASDTAYAIERLTKGLASSHAAARQGCAATLTTLLRRLPLARTSLAVRALGEAASLPAHARGGEERDSLFAKVFGGAVIARAGRLGDVSSESQKAAADVVRGWAEAAAARSWLRPISTEALSLALDARQLSREVFDGHVAGLVARVAGGSPGVLTADALALCLAAVDFACAVGTTPPKQAARVVAALGMGSDGSMVGAARGLQKISLSDATITDDVEADADEDEATVSEEDTWTSNTPGILRNAYASASAAFPDLHPCLTRSLSLYARAGVLLPHAVDTPEGFQPKGPEATASLVTVASVPGLAVSREQASASFDRWWIECVDPALLRGSTERRVTGLLLASAACRAVPAALLPLVLSRRVCKLVVEGLGKQGGSLRSAARLLVESIVSAAQARTEPGWRDLNGALAAEEGAGEYATAAVMALVTRGHGRFDSRTRTSTVKTLRALMGPEALGTHAASLMGEFASPGDAAVTRRSWALESLCATARAAGDRLRAIQVSKADADAVEARGCGFAIDRVVSFLAFHARFEASADEDLTTLCSSLGLHPSALRVDPPLSPSERQEVGSRLAALIGELIAMRVGGADSEAVVDSVLGPARCANRWVGAVLSAIEAVEAQLDAGDGTLSRVLAESPVAGALRVAAAGAALHAQRLAERVHGDEARCLSGASVLLSVSALTVAMVTGEADDDGEAVDVASALCTAVRDLMKPLVAGVDAAPVNAASGGRVSEEVRAREMAKAVLGRKVTVPGHTGGGDPWKQLEGALLSMGDDESSLSDEEEDEEAPPAVDAFARLMDNCLALLANGSAVVGQCVLIGARGLAPMMTVPGIRIVVDTVTGKALRLDDATADEEDAANNNDDSSDEDEDDDDQQESGSESSSTSSSTSSGRAGKRARSQSPGVDAKRAKPDDDAASEASSIMDLPNTEEEAEAAMRAQDDAIAAVLKARRDAEASHRGRDQAERKFRLRAVEVLDALGMGVSSRPLVGVLVAQLAEAVRWASRLARSAKRSSREGAFVTDAQAMGEKVSHILKRISRAKLDKLSGADACTAEADALTQAVRGASPVGEAIPDELRLPRLSGKALARDKCSPAIAWLLEGAVGVLVASTKGAPGDAGAAAEAVSSLVRCARVLGRASGAKGRSSEDGLTEGETAVMSRAVVYTAASYLSRRGSPLSSAFFEVLLRRAPQTMWTAVPALLAMAADAHSCHMPFRRAEAWGWVSALFRGHLSDAGSLPLVCAVPETSEAAVSDETMDALFSPGSAEAAGSNETVRRALAAPIVHLSSGAALAERAVRSAATIVLESASGAPLALPAKRLRDVVGGLRDVVQSADKWPEPWRPRELASGAAFLSAARQLQGATTSPVLRSALKQLEGVFDGSAQPEKKNKKKNKKSKAGASSSSK